MYVTVCHAELNAVLNKNSADVKDCTIYVALFPCNECAKVIVQSGIREVVYASEKNAHKQENIASRRLLEMAGVKLTSVVDFNYTLLLWYLICSDQSNVLKHCTSHTVSF